MGLFDLGKKKEAFVPEVPETTPTEEVLKLRQQGLSNNQIVQSLQRSGYRTHQIFDAMNQADMRSAAPIQQAPATEPITSPPLEEEAPEPYPGEQQEQSNDERIEEIAEEIIDEKWQELVKNVNKIVEWKNAMDAKISSLEEENVSLKKSLESVQKMLFERVEKYDKNVAEVGINLKAMEQVFSKVLPTFTANVNELSRITKGIKGKKAQNTK